MGIVSDDPLFVEATSLGFRMGSEFAVFHCPGAAATPAEAIASCRFDAVLIDGDTGEALDLVRRLRAQAERPAVFVLSARGDRERGEKLLACGAAAVVSKAVCSGPLVSLVRETIEGRVLIGSVHDDGAEAPLAGSDHGDADSSADCDPVADVRLHVVACA